MSDLLMKDDVEYRMTLCSGAMELSRWKQDCFRNVCSSVYDSEKSFLWNFIKLS